MSYLLDSSLDAERRASCLAHDAADRAMDDRLLHRVPAPKEGRTSESCRRATCRALGLDPAAPLAFLTSPHAVFWAIVLAACLAVVAISLWAQRWAA